MNKINKFFTLAISLFLLVSCGSDPKQTSESSQVEEVKEKTLVEFNIRAVGNTMAEMKYDVENITVKEGSRVKITLVNEGIDVAMQHNILFVNFGKRKDVAAKAVQAGGDKNYIPEDPNLIAASDMAKPGQTVTLEFDAPKKGNYEFFCSYPGHSQMMRGYLFVK
jgi:azurin